MPDLSQEFIPRLQSARLGDLRSDQDFLLPDYQGGSILNLSRTICELFGIPGFGAQALRPEYLEPLRGSTGVPIRRVIMVLVDALALHRFRQWFQDGTASVWAPLVERGFLGALTSVFPSTTSCCLPSIWSGLSPAEHAQVGYELYLKEYGTTANMITHAPFTVGGVGSLEKAGFKPENALPGTTLGTHLTAHGIRPVAFQHYSIANSGLSRMFLRDLDIRSFGNAAELWIHVRNLLASTKGERLFTGVYWSQVDTLSHTYGPDHEQPQAEFAHFSQAFERFFLSQLPEGGYQDTLVLLVADHGQITTSKDPFYDLRNHPQLLRRLHMTPTGENRAAYFYVRPSQFGAVREYLDRTFMNQFVQMDPLYAVEQGLFGPGTPHERLADRLGDLLVLARQRAFLWWASKDNPIIGRHGGLHQEEMVVPLLGVRL